MHTEIIRQWKGIHINVARAFVEPLYNSHRDSELSMQNRTILPGILHLDFHVILQDIVFILNIVAASN